MTRRVKHDRGAERAHAIAAMRAADAQLSLADDSGWANEHGTERLADHEEWIAGQDADEGGDE
jgi:hypothetical protein